MTIPAQWIEYHQFFQRPGTSSISLNDTISLWEVGQLIITFPNSKNQLTVSRNPYLENVRCQIGNRIVPDKPMSTNCNAFSEMVMTSLGFDSLFSASRELTTAVSPIKQSILLANCYRPLLHDDSDFMFVVDLERNGSGTFCDGYSGRNVSIDFQANYINSTNNPHYYAYNEAKAFKIRDEGMPNLFAVGDAYWVFTEKGGEFIKDAAVQQLSVEREELVRRKEMEYLEQQRMKENASRYHNYHDPDNKLGQGEYKLYDNMQPRNASSNIEEVARRLEQTVDKVEKGMNGLE